MKKAIFLVSLMLFLLTYSCSTHIADIYGFTLDGYEYDLSDENASYLCSEERIQESYLLKQNIAPQTFEKEWVIDQFNKWIRDYDFHETGFHDLPGNYKDLVFDKVAIALDKKAPEIEAIFPVEEYFSPKNRLYLVDDLVPGDIILSRNVHYMNILLTSRYSLHHAYIVIEKPKTEENLCLMTSYPPESYSRIGEGVCRIPLSTLAWDEFLVVLRNPFLTEAEKDQLSKTALDQKGKSYNTDYILKSKTDSFYCTQFVYYCYLQLGLNIDSTHQDWDDHGIVLANDIFKSPYLDVVRYGN